MATVVEILELSGVPTLCAARATHAEAGKKIGAILADALQVSYLSWAGLTAQTAALHSLLVGVGW